MTHTSTITVTEVVTCTKGCPKPTGVVVPPPPPPPTTITTTYITTTCPGKPGKQLPDKPDTWSSYLYSDLLENNKRDLNVVCTYHPD